MPAALEATAKNADEGVGAPLINVGRPELEGERRNLKEDAAGNEDYARQKHRVH